MIFLIQEWLIVVLCCVYEERMQNSKCSCLPNDIVGLYTCTEHLVLLMGESITANTRKLLELCKYKVGQIPELVKVLS
jgi:hypothetical protein